MRRRFVAENIESRRRGVLTLYDRRAEPDPSIYAVLKRIPRDFVSEILVVGRWSDQAYEVAEEINGGALSDLGLPYSDVEIVRSIVGEIGPALHAFSEASLRHRDIRPANILVRARDPLDLVVIGFGSARLSEYDLDIVAPLETTRYMAPEAIAGGVATASDWWSLGMILLEGITQGACFDGVNEKAFLIHVVASGAPIPQGLDPSIELLLRGLLARDRSERWQWNEVRAWIAGEPVSAPQFVQTPKAEQGPSICLGSREYFDPRSYALAAGATENWNEAREQLLRGTIATWAEERALESRVRTGLREIARQELILEDLRLAIALKILNRSIPLIHRGEIINPGWLLAHPMQGYELVSGPIPDLLSRFELEGEEWLGRLKKRANAVRARAKSLDILLDEETLRVHLLSSSRALLNTLWDERRKLFPDTEHVGLISIMERRQIAEEDLIILVGSAPSQFRSISDIVAESASIAQNAGVAAFDTNYASSLLSQPRRDLFLEIDRRLEAFARCGIAAVDEWADQYRLEKRMPLARAAVILAIPQGQWAKPARQQYVSQIIDFFAKKIAGTVLRGPLVRMTIGTTTARVDITELHRDREGATAVLNHILARSDRTLSIDPTVFAASDTLENRTRALHAHAMLYRRDTGIDGLYLGFPFLLLQEKRGQTKPRIAPVLLWPIRLGVEVGGRGNVSIAFDRDREEVRLNPAFDGLLGTQTAQKWRDVTSELLQRSALAVSDVIDAIGILAAPKKSSLVPLPSKDLKLPGQHSEIIGSAVLFHAIYMGQAIGEDLQKLKKSAPSDCALVTLLRASEGAPAIDALPAIAESEKYLTVESDPSQEAAVFGSRQGAGLLIEGPPGTGKSQTIVNAIGDAIGKGRSLLVVCQKLPALEVVKKRLEAEGLGDRIVMVTDTYKDRQAIIRALRTQRENLGNGDDASVTRLIHARHGIARQIETLERFIDNHHEAIHKVDEKIGKSYRDVISDLIELEGNAPPPDVPALRAMLTVLDQSGVGAVEDRLAPLARYWLPAEYENSPLATLRPFSADQVSIAAFLDVFESFAATEKNRLKAYREHVSPFDLEDPEPVRTWLRTFGDILRELKPNSRENAAVWFDLYHSENSSPPRSIQFLGELARIHETLRTARPADERLPFFDHLIELPDTGLRAWQHTAVSAVKKRSAFGKFWPPNLFKRRRLRKFIEGCGYSASDVQFGTVLTAVELELLMRDLRERFGAVERALDRDASLVSGATIHRLLDLVEATLKATHETSEIFKMVDACPMRDDLKKAIRSANKESIDQLFDQFLAALELHKANTRSTAALAQLSDWMNSDWVQGCHAEIRQRRSNEESVGPIIASKDSIPAYQLFRLRSKELEAGDFLVLRALRKRGESLRALQLDHLDPMVRRIIRREVCLGWKSKLEGAEPSLLAAQEELRTKISQLAKVNGEMRAANRRLLIEHIDQKRVSPLTSWSVITRLTGPRTLRLREFIDRGADLGLMALRPVWLMNPDAASRVLPLKQGMFDVVIYDEASQMPVEYALPTLYRAKQATVSGDEKQMPPTSFFASKVESDEAEIYDGEELDEDASHEERQIFEETWNRREIKDCPDLLHLARATLPSTTLMIHYRSVYRELIDFSNASFYANRLNVPVGHPEDEIRKIRPIEVISVQGIYENQTNLKEAERVVDVLAEIWQSSDSRPSLGVVTFNRKQADLIEELIEKRAEQDDAFRRVYIVERDRIDDGEDMGAFVKNVENVQGDERDIIVFSTTFGRTAAGVFRRNFGVLGQTGGERRLNVAITRARRKIILVTSMPVSDVADLLTTHHAPSRPRDYLQAYLEYARLISDGDLVGARHLARRMVASVDVHRAEPRKQDGFARSVESFIRTLGYEAETTGADDAFGFDYAIVDKRTGRYGIGIECDAPRHLLLKRARDREIWRPKVLERAIPHFHRVSSSGWYHEAAAERSRLAAAIRTAVGGVA